MVAFVYRLIALTGLMSVFGSFMWGFRYQPSAPIENIYFNIAIFVAYMCLHLMATRNWFKKTFFGSEIGHKRERQIFITHTIIGWALVLYFHKPMGGMEYMLPSYLGFLGLCLSMIGVFMFLEDKSFGFLDSFLGVPGAEITFSHGPETPLMDEGSYSKVRHPMYTGVFIIGSASLLIHPNIAQLIWVGMIGTTFLMFIPIEEAQLKKERGDQYIGYMARVKYRLIKGIW